MRIGQQMFEILEVLYPDHLMCLTDIILSIKGLKVPKQKQVHSVTMEESWREPYCRRLPSAIGGKTIKTLSFGASMSRMSIVRYEQITPENERSEYMKEMRNRINSEWMATKEANKLYASHSRSLKSLLDWELIDSTYVVKRTNKYVRHRLSQYGLTEKGRTLLKSRRIVISK